MEQINCCTEITMQDSPNPGTRDSPSSPRPWSRACTPAGTCTGSPGRPTSWACATSAAAAASSRTTSGQSPRSCRPRGAEREPNLYDVCITLITLETLLFIVKISVISSLIGFMHKANVIYVSPKVAEGSEKHGLWGAGLTGHSKPYVRKR